MGDLTGRRAALYLCPQERGERARLPCGEME
jgi:hypothetical protein